MTTCPAQVTSAASAHAALVAVAEWAGRELDGDPAPEAQVDLEVVSRCSTEAGLFAAHLAETEQG